MTSRVENHSTQVSLYNATTAFWANYALTQARRRQRWMVRARKEVAREFPNTAHMCVTYARQCHRDVMSARSAMHSAEV